MNFGIITKDLNWQKQTEKSCKTANRVLGCIAPNFRYRNKSLVCPHFEHAVQLYSPGLRRDIETIQRRATKMTNEIRNHRYHLRIHDLDLISIEQTILNGKSFRTVNSFKNSLDKHWAGNPPNVRVNC